MIDSKFKIDIPKYPRVIIETLNNNGFEAYIVGGCVRDILLGEKPTDYDITTNAKPQDIKKIFKKTIDTGIKHGTVTVLFYENDVPKTYEVTTYRIDGDYKDGRHPEEVYYVNNLKEDLKRRDFTINAMAYNDDVGLVDEFGGVTDLKNKIINTVGSPYERFEEDALRLLRAIRFAAKLDFSIDKKTREAIPLLASNLRLISKERIQVELTKTLISKRPEYIGEAFNLGLAKYICDGFENIKTGKFDKFLPVHIAYACLLYNENEESAYKILKELKLSNNVISNVILLLKGKALYKDLEHIINESKKVEIANLKVHFLGKESYVATEFEILIKKLIDLLKYDLIYDFIRLIEINEENKKLISDLKKKVDYFKEINIPIFTKDIDVDGKSLIDIGYKGEMVGFAINKIKEIIHKYPEFNEKKLLQEVLKKAYNIYVGRENFYEL